MFSCPLKECLELGFSALFVGAEMIEHLKTMLIPSIVMLEFFFSCRPEDGRSMKSFSLLQIMRLFVILYEWLDIPILKRYYDFGFDHYNLQWHKAGVMGLVDALLNRNGPFAHGNWVLPDLSIQYALQLNKQLRTFDKTFYFRCVKLKRYFTIVSWGLSIIIGQWKLLSYMCCDCCLIQDMLGCCICY
jgi:hypothetical protein